MHHILHINSCINAIWWWYGWWHEYSTEVVEKISSRNTQYIALLGNERNMYIGEFMVIINILRLGTINGVLYRIIYHEKRCKNEQVSAKLS